tara:strand:- start:4266 stop:5297 length:1032 start_codon:yes stop_codon:yes gene_type:complete
LSVLFTPEIISEITAILADHHAAVAAALYGQESVTPEAWDLAVDLGLVDPTTNGMIVSQQLQQFGAFMAHLDHAEQFSRYGMDASDFMAEVKRNPVPMTSYEQAAATTARAHAAQYVVGLGNKIGATLGSTLIEADRVQAREMRSVLRDVVSARFGDDEATRRMRARGIKDGKAPEFYERAFRSTTKRMASDMGHATKDWSRNFTRIAQTETQRMFEEGLKDSWQAQEVEKAKQEKRPMERVVAYKIPRPDACKHCLRLHRDAAGDLRLFYLDDLEGNGVNVGRRAAEWLAVVGPVHPYCACQLVRLPRFIELPVGWRSGQAAPSIVSQDGLLGSDDSEDSAL